MVADELDYVIGVDTHLDEHVLAILAAVSRSWIRKRGRWLRSSRSISRLRACWVIHDVSGLLVQAMYSTRRVPIETKNSTYRRRSQTVSTGRTTWAPG
jgi:hypothetical protein